MAEVISYESNFNQVQTSQRAEYLLSHQLFVMLLLEDSGKARKVTMRADITQQQEKKPIMKKRHGIGERNTTKHGFRVWLNSGNRWINDTHKEMRKKEFNEKEQQEERSAGSHGLKYSCIDSSHACLWINCCVSMDSGSAVSLWDD